MGSGTRSATGGGGCGLGDEVAGAIGAVVEGVGAGGRAGSHPVRNNAKHKKRNRPKAAMKFGISRFFTENLGKLGEIGRCAKPTVPRV